LRLCPHKKAPASGNTHAQTIANSPENGDAVDAALATEAVVAKLRVALAVPVPGITLAGEKLQLIPAARPEQARATALSNDPFCAATLML
jgi:hypothetical protein